MALTLGFSDMASGQFVAFNDHAPGVIGVTTHRNATTWNIMGNAPGSGGVLKNIASGAALPVRVAITRSGTVTAGSMVGAPNSGTPLYNTFNGYVDFEGGGSDDAAILVTGSSTVVYTFTGLNPGRTYSFKGGAVRGGNYLQRWSLFELDGARSFTSAHTSGCYTAGLGANQVAINTGANTSGDMTDWEDIVPGASGSFSVRTTQYTGAIPSGDTASGPYCYALSGFRLEEFVPGTTAPALVSVTNSDTSSLTVVFSIPLDGTATNAANYSLTNLDGNVPILAAAFGADNKTVVLTTASQEAFARHWLTVNRVADATGLNIIATNSQLSFINIAFTTGYIWREFYTNILGSDIGKLTASPKFPNSPDRVDYPPSFGFPQENLDDYYGVRMSGYLVPPISGQYYFAIRSDDASQFFMSTNENPDLKYLITEEPGCCETFDAHNAGPFTLAAGKRYYVEALLKENTGGDYVYVAWKTPANNDDWEVIPGQYLGNALTDPAATLAISRQPSSQSVMAGQTATFSVAAQGSSIISTNLNYQWQLNGVDIPGATVETYTTPVLREADGGSVYRAQIFLPGKGLLSSKAVLTVTPDIVPPTVARVVNVGTGAVQILFSEPVQASATNVSSYVFTNGLPVTGAALDASGLLVTLSTEPLVFGSNYSIVINGILDDASVPNIIATNTVATFVAYPFTPLDIGNPGFTTVATEVTNGLDVVGSGADIGGFADQFHFDYQLRSGDFDVSVRLAGMGFSDVWAKAGLMARETLDSSSRFAAALATPSMAGAFFESRTSTNTRAASTGSMSVNYPNTWLRLKRAGNVFSGFASLDGQTWTPLGSATMVMPGQIYFGMVLSSYDSSRTETVEFRDLGEVSPDAVIGTVALPHELPGPCSRRTGIVFSEIMYKPAPRADTNNVEFLEIFNSNPFFQDIGGYQIVADNLSYTFPSGTTLGGGEYRVIAASPAGIQNVYGVAAMGPYTGSLKKSGTLQLLDEQGAVLLVVPYSNLAPWPVAACGTGHSLVLANPTYGEADPRAWDISDRIGGSPGMMDAFTPSPLRNVLINEFLAHTDDPEEDYIELYNHANQAVDISGCILTDDFATNKFVVPPGTVIAARGFVYFTQTELNFSLDAAGETIFFKNPDQMLVLDAVQFEGQENGVAMGRLPDGAKQFYRLSAKTPGAPNSSIRISDVVLNELMYNPISKNDDDEYVELYNRSTNSVNLSGWQLSDGITFTFPTNTLLAPDQYLVVARNVTNLLAKYPNLNADNTVGPFSGKLSNGGERIALTMPGTVISATKNGFATNLIPIAVDEVTYGTGGRWGEWADGGGSSLEAVDPSSNRRLASSWADSDETQKSSWANIETTGVLDNGLNYGSSFNYAQIGLLFEGECLVDDIEVRLAPSGPNLVSNSDFENGLANWSMQGDHSRSSLETPGYSSGHSLHIRASDSMGTGVNACQVSLASSTLSAGKTAVLRFKARWLRGWPEALLRINGNWLEAAGALPVPSNLGTPGARNSRYVTNAGPAIYEVTHSPAVPAANQDAVVTAKIHDPEGVQNFRLNYRIDPSASETALPMRDDGVGGDAIAGDGVFSATIPGQTGGTTVAFFLSATDALSAATRFPALAADGRPVPECVVRFGDDNPTGAFGVFHLWVTQTNLNRWISLADLSNEMNDGTVVNGTRVIYNAGARFTGSPYHQNFDSPTGNPCHYTWAFPKDDLMLGSSSFDKVHQVGNFAGDDPTLQREQTAFTFLRALRQPWLYRRYIAVYVNGNRRGTLMEDTQKPNGSMVDEHFPGDTDGFLYKMQQWMEYDPFPSGTSIGFSAGGGASLMPYTTSGGLKKTARYRYNYLSRITPDSGSNFTNVFALVDVAGTHGSANYVANLQKIADMENWMRLFAAAHASGDWDCFGGPNGQNIYSYVGVKGTRFSLLMYDFNLVFNNSQANAPGKGLFDIDGSDSSMAAIYSTPVFRRMYLRALKELARGPMSAANYTALLDARYKAFLAAGIAADSPQPLKNWLSQAGASVATQVAAEDRAGFTLSAPSASATNTVTVTGTAPVDVASVLFNGVAFPMTWNSVTAWTAPVALQPGTNIFTAIGVNTQNQPVSGASNVFTVICNAAIPNPLNPYPISINEWMASNTKTIKNPLNSNKFDDWFELYNCGTNSVDLAGCYLTDTLSLSNMVQIPPGFVIAPRTFLLVWADDLAPASGTGDLHVKFKLSKDGEAIGLFSTNGTPIDTVTFGAQADDVSQGRFPEMGSIYFLTTPTPGGSNRLSISFSAAAAGTNLVFQWPSIEGQNYQLDYRDDLGAGEWLPWGDLILGDGGPLAVTNDLSAAQQRFFRLTVQP